VCYLDLDQFKIINDTCGTSPATSDRQLRTSPAERVRSNDALARLGGDEFGLLLHDCSMADASTSPRAAQAVEQYQFVWGASTFTVGASIGVVPVERNFRGSPRCCRRRCGVLCRQDEGRNRVHVYQEDDTVVAQRHGEMQWVARVKRALNENRFFLEAQPIVPTWKPARTARRASYELLVRMRELDWRVVPPAHSCRSRALQPDAAVDRWVISHALHWLARIQRDAARRDGLRESVGRFAQRAAAARFHPHQCSTRRACRREDRLRDHRDRGDRQPDARQSADRRAAPAGCAFSSTISAAAFRPSPISRR
jgi:diguanylate cyclase (GGDEF)-like protein